MKRLSKPIIIFLVSVLLLGVLVLTVNFYVILSARSRIVDDSQLTEEKAFDAVLVLGCGVRKDGTPSHMLFERVKAGCFAFEKTTSDRLVLSGDKSGDFYDEPGVMNTLALENGISEGSIVLDTIGFSTYESLYNAANAGYDKLLIITQPYHLPRALHIAKSLGLDAYGYEAWLPFYPKQIIWSAREILARNKDFIKCLFD